MTAFFPGWKSQRKSCLLAYADRGGATDSGAALTVSFAATWRNSIFLCNWPARFSFPCRICSRFLKSARSRGKLRGARWHVACAAFIFSESLGRFLRVTMPIPFAVPSAHQDHFRSTASPVSLHVWVEARTLSLEVGIL
jgi:hypothetical protein